MSFLAPLYLAGLAALSLPIVLHLIRRVPRGRLPFSTLMFLTQSPPRITRRSRIDHWLLLLLRAAIVTLLVLAFTRPFLRESSQLTTSAPHGRRMVVLLDTSASMRRDNLWTQAISRVEEIVEQAGPRDEVAIFAFDDQLRPVVDFSNDDESAIRRTPAAVRKQLDQLAPSWGGTKLGEALATAAERLVERNDRRQSDAALQIYVVGDLQQGADLDALQAYDWPAQVAVELLPLEPGKPGNASLQLIAEAEGHALPDEVRVLVSNEPDAAHEQFELAWLTPDGTPTGRPVRTYVPPGQSRTVRMRRPTAEQVTAIQLTGDQQPFDNRIYLAPYERPAVRVLYAGSDAPDDPQGVVYFLELALSGNPNWDSELVTVSDEASLRESLMNSALVVTSGQWSSEVAEVLRRYAEQGGSVLVALSDDSPPESLRTLLADDQWHWEEATQSDYAMLADIDFNHAIFAPLADPQYSDFTKVRFWKWRNLTWAPHAELKVLARFDDGRPALVEQTVGEGRVFVLASTWRPADSQLALSSKFVPLIGGVLRSAGIQPANDVRLTVGQPLPLEASAASPGIVWGPEGERFELPAGADRFEATRKPGVYRREGEGGEQVFAVNLDPAESRTAPLDPTRLEQYAIRLGTQPDEQAERERQRQLHDQELESRQQIWRWMIAAGLGCMVLETLLAGRAARASQSAPLREPMTVREKEVAA